MGEGGREGWSGSWGQQMQTIIDRLGESSSPGGSEVNNLPVIQETQVQSLIGKSPWRREWQPTPVFLPGKSQGQRSLVGCSPWGRKESDMTE